MAIIVSRFVVATAAATVAVATLAPAQSPPTPALNGAAKQAAQPSVHQGERLDPATYGESYIESMAEAIARQELRAEGLTGDKSRKPDQKGLWTVPSRRSTDFPHSGLHNVGNKWGDLSMGIGFPGRVDFHGVWVAAQGNRGAWTTGVRAVAYRAGAVVGTTDWFRQIGSEPAWFALDMQDIDRVVFEAEAVIAGAGWYSLDDLTYTPRVEPGAEPAQRVIVDFEDAAFNTRLTDTGYAGLTWEPGGGVFDTESLAVPPPVEAADADGERPDPAAVVPPPPPGTVQNEPVLEFDFQATIRGDAGSFSYPPDTCGAVGPTHFVMTANRNFQIYVKSNGALVTDLHLGAFLPGSSGDPRVLYDQHSERWVVTVPDFNTRVYLAVSETSDPTGDWFKTSFVVSADADAGCWPDYPTLGVDENGIYVASYMVGCGTTIWAIDKAPLIDPNPSLGTITAYRGLPLEGAVQPAHTYGSSGGVYLVSRANTTQIRVRQITGDLSMTPVLNEVGFTSIPDNFSPPDAPALESTVLLDTVGHRLMNAVYRDGLVWTAHTVDVDGRAASRWYAINASVPSLQQSGTVSDPDRHYFFPTIAVNDRGDALMGFSGSSPTEYASCYFTARGSNDTPGAMSTPQLLKAGVAAQNNIDGFGRNRFGDYSLTSLDPADELTIWTVQEYAHDVDIWGTWIGKVSVLAAPANNACTTAQLAQDGDHPFTNVNANTDGFPETLCNFGGDTDVTDDVWLLYLAPCDGDATLTLTGLDYDARAAVYPSAVCPGGPDTAIGCIQAPGQTQLTFAVNAGSPYRIRVGGLLGSQGSGTVNLSCAPGVAPCPEDCANGNGEVDVTDLLEVLAQWGNAGPCDIDGGGTIDVSDLLAVLGEWGPC